MDKVALLDVWKHRLTCWLLSIGVCTRSNTKLLKRIVSEAFPAKLGMEYEEDFDDWLQQFASTDYPAWLLLGASAKPRFVKKLSELLRARQKEVLAQRRVAWGRDDSAAEGGDAR